MNAVELKDVKRSFGDFHLEVDHLDVPAGYVTVLLGPNAAGKTTLLKSILGLVPPDEGGVTCFGHDMSRSARSVKARIGFVHEQDYLFEDLTPAATARILKRFYPSWDDALFESLLERLGVQRGKKIKKMSRGTRMKCSFIMALAHNPDLLLLDEPMSGLDPLARIEMLGVIAGWMRKEDRTAVLSSHITSDLDKIADYIVFLKDGRIVRSGSRTDLLDRYMVCKGSLDLLVNGNRRLFDSVREYEYGFRGLTSRPEEVRIALGEDLVFDRPNLEDLMVFTFGEEDR